LTTRQFSTALAKQVVRILLVDDTPEFLNTAADFLSTVSQLEIVGQLLSSLDALEQAPLLRPDLVLMDVALPEMNGLEATRRLKMQPNAPRVIILTMDDNAEYRAEIRAVGADGFITKSEFGAQLLPLIDSLFDESTPHSENEGGNDA